MKTIASLILAFSLASSPVMAGPVSYEVIQTFPLYTEGSVGYSVFTRTTDESSGYQEIMYSEIICKSDVYEDLTVQSFAGHDYSDYQMDIIVPNRTPVRSERFAYKIWNSLCISYN